MPRRWPRQQPMLMNIVSEVVSLTPPRDQVIMIRGMKEMTEVWRAEL